MSAAEVFLKNLRLKKIELPMPRFYFDIRNGPHFVPDEEGLELSDLEAAKSEAVKSLADLTREVKPDGHDTSVTIEVRQDGEIVFRAGLDIEVHPAS